MYFANINGINTNYNYENFHPLLENMNTLKTDISCFVEHNLDVTQTKIRYDLQKVTKRHIPTSSTIATTSPTPFPSSFKPGGCMNIIAKTIRGRITEQGQDAMGRWTYIRLATKQSSMIYIITAYKPCKTTLNQAGPFTVFRQQWTEMRNKGITNPQPRKQFDKDLLNFIHTIQQQHHRIILVGDFNEPSTNSELLKQLHQLRLRDMIRQRHPQLPRFRSCNKGGNIIDFAFCSLSLLPSVLDSTYEPFMLNVNSDHRA